MSLMLQVRRKERGGIYRIIGIFGKLLFSHKFLFSVLTLDLCVQQKFYLALFLNPTERAKLFVVLIPLLCNKCGTQEIC